MSLAPFDPRTDLEPVPFHPDVLELAARLKRAGLRFRPHVGCFVWDPEGVIDAPSPFPHRIYFILNLQRFEQIFGSMESIQERLVWVPTETQARAVLAKLGGEADTPATGTRELYELILKGLGA